MENMTASQIEILLPAIRLVNGFEMAAYRDALVDSLKEENMNEPDSIAVAEQYHQILNYYTMSVKVILA
jgi:hypothetical protein